MTLLLYDNITLAFKQCHDGHLLVLELPNELCLHSDGRDVHPVPREGPQHLQLRPFNVQDKQIHPELEVHHAMKHIILFFESLYTVFS